MISINFFFYVLIEKMPFTYQINACLIRMMKNVTETDKYPT